MNELRWILLAAGLVLIAGIYFWGLRARRSVGSGQGRATRVEPARTVPVVAEPTRPEPEVLDREAVADGDELEEAVEPDLERVPVRAAGGPARREARVEPRLDVRIEPAASATATDARTERRMEPRFEPDTPDTTRPRPAERPAPAAEPAGKREPQKIVAVRVVATAGALFAGDKLLAALEADGFVYGRYQIFHRLDESGRPLVSLASLKEPGTFDPEAMPGTQLRGVVLFAVIPGPLPAVRAFDELIVTARALAATLDGQLQDERGGPLTLQRIGHLREEVAGFERARGAPPGA